MLVRSSKPTEYAATDQPHLLNRQLLLYVTTLPWVLGVFVFFGLTALLSVYFVLGYAALLLASLHAVGSSRDWLNPLFLVIVLGCVRFGIPGAMVALGNEPDFQAIGLMRIQTEEWILGHALALMGLLGVVTGWLLDPRLPATVIHRMEFLTHFRHRGFPVAAILCIGAGFLSLAIFVGSNLSLQDAVYGGELRQTEIRVGTGNYFYLALMLVAGSVLLTGYLTESGCLWWIAMLPASFAMLSYSVLGGRVMAFAPLAAAALVLWYRGGPVRLAWKKWAFALGLPALPVFSYVGQLYRGGGGIQGVVEGFSLVSLRDYMEYALWLDWGNLHSMAAAIMIGPGVLGGRTFSLLFWPLTEFLGFAGQSAGVLMATTLLGVRDRPWGFHATLIGDAYLNFGLWGVLTATVIFGMALRILYAQVRPSVSNTAIYALAAIYSLRILYISIEEFPHALATMCFAVFAVQLGRMLTLPSVARSSAVGISRGRRA